MVNMKHENNDDIEVNNTNDEDTGFEDIELENAEATSKDKQKQLREKLATCEEEKKKILDDSQLAKADFLNAKKRIEEERIRDRERSKIRHMEELLPLCDSFQMAMSDKDAWAKADETWRKGIEGIHLQLKRILDTNEVTEVIPEGETFDPYKHEAVGTEEVEDAEKQDVVISVVQRGYEMTIAGKTETIRPARVTTGIVKE
jgi:molecular chaperone GrpE